MLRTDLSHCRFMSSPPFSPNSYPQPSSSATAGTQLAAPGTYQAVPDVSVAWKSEPVNSLMGRLPNSRHEAHPSADYDQAAAFYQRGLSERDRQNLHTNIAYSLRTVTRKEVVVRFLLACHRTLPALAQGVYAELVKECERAQQKPNVDWEEIQQCAKQLEGKPLVDVSNGYRPAPLPISL
jgi:catalase